MSWEDFMLDGRMQLENVGPLSREIMERLDTDIGTMKITLEASSSVVECPELPREKSTHEKTIGDTPSSTQTPIQTRVAKRINMGKEKVDDRSQEEQDK